MGYSLQLSATSLNDDNVTMIQGWGCLYPFSLLLSKLSNLWTQIYLLSLITYKCLYILQMRAVLKNCLQHLRYKCKYASPTITLISTSLIFQNISKTCTGAFLVVFHLLRCFLGWLLTMLLHQRGLETLDIWLKFVWSTLIVIYLGGFDVVYLKP